MQLHRCEALGCHVALTIDNNPTPGRDFTQTLAKTAANISLPASPVLQSIGFVCRPSEVVCNPPMVSSHPPPVIGGEAPPSPRLAPRTAGGRVCARPRGCVPARSWSRAQLTLGPQSSLSPPMSPALGSTRASTLPGSPTVFSLEAESEHIDADDIELPVLESTIEECEAAFFHASPLFMLG